MALLDTSGIAARPALERKAHSNDDFVTLEIYQIQRGPVLDRPTGDLNVPASCYPAGIRELGIECWPDEQVPGEMVKCQPSVGTRVTYLATQKNAFRDLSSNGGRELERRVACPSNGTASRQDRS